MSHTTMLGLREHETVELEEFRNSHGSAMRVWRELAERYLPGGSFSFITGRNQTGLWGLQGDPRLSRAERAALIWTFDRALCQRERARELAELLREFGLKLPAPRTFADHLPAIADALGRHARDPSFVAFAWIQTSVCSDVWYEQDRCPNRFHDEGEEDGLCDVCGNERDDRRLWRPFTWGLDKDRGHHYFIFDEDGGVGGLP